MMPCRHAMTCAEVMDAGFLKLFHLALFKQRKMSHSLATSTILHPAPFFSDALIIFFRKEKNKEKDKLAM